MQSFAAAPQAVAGKSRYRPEDDTRNNIMHDKRVVRGNTYASLVAPPQPDPAELQRKRDAQRRRMLRANATRKRAGTPEPVAGRKHMDIQTDSYLEELTERTVEFEAETQTDFLLDRPPSPLFMPAKIGVDCETQIEDNELFDFDVEVEPILEIFVGKTLEQAMMEVLEEEELASLQRYQEEFLKRRNAELLEVQRMEAAEVRRHEEMERRMKQQADQKEKELRSMQMVVSRSIASIHLSSLKNRALAHLLDAGVFADSVERGVETGFMPELFKKASEKISEKANGRQVLGEIMQSVTSKKFATQAIALDAERRRLKAIDDAVREARNEIAEEKRIQEENEKRIQRGFGRMLKWEAKFKKPPKVTSYPIESFDGEAALLSDGRKVKTFLTEKMKEDLQDMLLGLRGAGERAVCQISTDTEAVIPDDADPSFDLKSQVVHLRKFNTNNFALEILAARGMRDYPCDAYVVVKDVEGFVGDSLKTDIVEQTTAPEWNFNYPSLATYKLAGLEFEVRDANPEKKSEDGEDDLLLKCYLPVDMLYDACGKTKPGEEIKFDAWLEASERQKREESAVSQGELHVRITAKFNIPIMLPGAVIDLPDKFQIGLAWEFIKADDPVDLDASVVALDTQEKIVDQVWFQKLKGMDGAVSHSGDNQSGDADGDDETIAFDLTKMPKNVEKVAVVINSYEQRPLDKCIRFAYLRIIVEGVSYGFFSMGEGWLPHCTGMFFGSIRKRPDGWKFITTAVAANGATVQDSLPAVIAHGKKALGW